MLTNGKFQGDDSFTREMTAQTGTALCPILHTTHRNSAAVIGLGTGVSARTIHDAGFKHIDVVELSRDVLNMADNYFTKVNRGLTGVRELRFMLPMAETSCRSPGRYDLIHMEISSIWFAGAANLYNREFYKIVKSRLARDGVFQQWLQLHRLEPEDILSVIATIRSEFRFVWLYFVGNQGILVATNGLMMPSEETILALDNEKGLSEILSYYKGSSRALLSSRLLDPRGIDQLLGEAEQVGVSTESLISTDDNLFLESQHTQGKRLGLLKVSKSESGFLDAVFSPLHHKRDSFEKSIGGGLEVSHGEQRTRILPVELSRT